MAAGVAVAAWLSAPKHESVDDLVDRLVDGTLRRGDAHKPWYAAHVDPMT